LAILHSFSASARIAAAIVRPWSWWRGGSCRLSVEEIANRSRVMAAPPNASFLIPLGPFHGVVGQLVGPDQQYHRNGDSGAAYQDGGE